MPPDGDQLPLRTDESLERIGRLESVILRMETELPGLRAHPRVVGHFRGLQRAKTALLRERRRVGLLGPSNSGKSTTINRAFGSASGGGGGDGPALVNQQAGTTRPAVSARFFRIDEARRHQAAASEQHLCTLRYITPELLEERRRALCRLLGFDPALPDASLIEKIGPLPANSRSVYKLSDSDSDSDSERLDSGPHLSISSWETLAALISSARAFGPDYVAEPARVEVGDYQRRAEYLYVDQGSAREQTRFNLLGQVEIAIDTLEFPEGLELDETPDVGGLDDLDDSATLSAIDELDGALVFQSAERPGFEDARETLRRLERRFPSRTDRIWLVITHFDALADAVEAEEQGRGDRFLSELASFLREVRIPPCQVILAADGPLPPGALPADELERHPSLKESVKAVLADGGSSRIHTLMWVIAEGMARQVREDASAELVAIEKGLEAELRLASDLAGYDVESFYRAVRWRVALQKVIDGFAEDRTLLEGSAGELIDRLRDLFGNELCPPNLLIRPDRLSRAHKDYVLLLKMEATRFARESVLNRTFSRVTGSLEEIESKVGPIVMKGYSSPLEVWNALRENDLAEPDWYLREFATFAEGGFLEEDQSAPIPMSNYRDLMLNKIALTVHRATYVLRFRLAGHLAALCDDLTWLADSKGIVSDHDRDALERILSELVTSASR